MPLLRVLLIDPHNRFRESARKYLLRCREFRSVEVAASYNEGLLLNNQHFPDLILVDSDYLYNNTSLLHELENLKQSNPSLDVLALSLFRDDHNNRCPHLSSLVSGFIYKENFIENLFTYLLAKEKEFAGKQIGLSKEVDWCKLKL